MSIDRNQSGIASEFFVILNTKPPEKVTNVYHFSLYDALG